MTPASRWLTTASQNRAPSTWSGTPCRVAISATCRVYAGVNGWPIEWACVFSIVMRPVSGSWASDGSRNASSIAARSIVPSGRSSSERMLVPTMTAWPAASSMTRWCSRPAIVSSPRRRCASCETRLPIVPEATNRPASLPSSSAARSWRAMTVGSSPNTSSPTSASAIARRMAGDGFVTVSLRRSIRVMGGVRCESSSGCMTRVPSLRILCARHLPALLVPIEQGQVARVVESPEVAIAMMTTNRAPIRRHVRGPTWVSFLPLAWPAGRSRRSPDFVRGMARVRSPLRRVACRAA